MLDSLPAQARSDDKTQGSRLIAVDTNRAAYEQDADTYSDRSLMPSERRILSLLSDRWPEIDMLDVGIGPGRTTYTFGAVAKRYVGIDYSPRMIELAKQLPVDEKGIDLAVADARDLSSIQGPFDFVLFSYNGLDSVGPEDRLTILREVRGVLKPDGTFLFSTHSMNALPLTPERPRGNYRSRLRIVYAWLTYARLLGDARKVNRKLDLEAARKKGWTVIRDGAHDFKAQYYYVDPAYQVRQLRDMGFETIAVYDARGREVQAKSAGRDPWLHYYCRPA